MNLECHSGQQMLSFKPLIYSKILTVAALQTAKPERKQTSGQTDLTVSTFHLLQRAYKVFRGAVTDDCIDV